MPVSQSFAIGVLGMRAFDSQMQGISNNIANVSTTGYKRSVTTFADLVAPESGGGPEANMGVKAASQKRISAPGQVVRTDGELDAAIAGRGFFRVTPNLDGSQEAGRSMPGTLYTRDGSFRMTSGETGTYLTTQEGYYVHGWQVDPDTGVVDSTTGPMQFSTYGILPQQPTTTVKLTGYLPVDGSLASAPVSFSAFVNDTLPEEAAAQDAAIGAPGPDGEIQVPPPPAPGSLPYNYSMQFNTATTNWELFDPSGTLVAPMTVSGGDFQNVTHGGFTFDFSDFYYFGTGTNAMAISTDGAPRGRLTGYGIDRQGNVSERFDNGFERTRFRLAAFNTVNEDTMKAIKDTYFAPSTEPGGLSTGVFVEAVQDGSQNPLTGFVPSSLEQSNVDLAEEMTSLITAQRNYQAASKTITTADEMTQTLVQIA